jgi:hypothetical protein
LFSSDNTHQHEGWNLHPYEPEVEGTEDEELLSQCFSLSEQLGLPMAIGEPLRVSMGSRRPAA